MALSKTQTKRLGGLLSVMFKEDVPAEHIEILIKEGYVLNGGDALKKEYVLSEKGLDEKTRLCTLAGLNIMYSSEVKQKEEKTQEISSE